MKKIELILSSLLLLTLASITEGSGKPNLNKNIYTNTYESTSLTLSLDANEENNVNKVQDYSVEKLDSIQPWVQLPLSSSAYLKSVVFINDSVGFAVGFQSDDEQSLILKTTDGGINWTRYNLTTRNAINSVALVDSNTLIAVGGGWNGIAFESLIYKTTNLGNTWERIILSDGYEIFSVSFYPKGNGIIVGEMGVIYISTDKGSTWTIKRMPISWTDLLLDVCFLDEKNVFAVGMDGNIFKSSDSGNNWVTINPPTTKYLFAIKNVNENLYIAGESGLVLFSNDSGNTWQSQTRVTTAHLRGIYFTSTNDGYIVGGTNNLPGGRNAILKTTDGGVTWQKQTHISNYVMTDVFFVDDSTGWIVGNSGLILKTTSGGVTFVEYENNLTQPEEFLLKQNYPNPFNPSTSIQYAITSTQFVTLKVYDLLGREVATLVNEEKTAGSYNVEFRMQNLELSSGIYFYKLQAGDFVETKKMILLK